MPCDLNLRLRRALIWYTRPKAGMRPAAVVMRRPRFQGLPNVRFVERDYKVQTLSASTTDQALAKSIGLGRFVRSLQDGQPQRFQRCVQLAEIDPVTVMDHKSVTFIASNTFSKLLKRPLGSRMLSNVKVKDSPRVEFHDHKDINQLERCGDNDKEVAGDNGFRMIADERHPALAWVQRTFGRLRHVAPNSARRNLNANLQQEFIGNPFLSPCQIICCHFVDQLAHLDGNPRSATRPRFPFPKQTEPFAMPTDERVGFDDREGIPPIEKAGEPSQRKAIGVGGLSRFCFSLGIEAELS